VALDKATLYSVGTINYSCVMRKMPWAFQVQAPGGRKGGREEERDVELCPQGCAVGEVGQALSSAVLVSLSEGSCVSACCYCLAVLALNLRETAVLQMTTGMNIL
jgi:hypothetical protein